MGFNGKCILPPLGVFVGKENVIIPNIQNFNVFYDSDMASIRGYQGISHVNIIPKLS